MKQRPYTNPVKEFTDSFNKLLTLFNQGRYAEAEALAKKLTVRFPQNGTGWKALGVMLMSQGRSGEALGPMKKAAKFLPGDAEAHSNLGFTLQELGRLTEAEAALLRALSINPGHAEAHNNLSLVLKELGRLTEAEASLRRALSISPDYAQAHYNLSLVLKELGRLTEAEASLRRVLSIKFDYVQAHNNLGIVLKKQGRLTEAEASYLRAIAIKPDYTEVYSNLAGVLKEQGRLTEAEACCVKAITNKPDYAEAHYNLGTVLQEMGRLTEAEASYLRAIESKPDYTEAHSNLLFTLAQDGSVSPEDYLARARSWDLTATTVEDRRAADEIIFNNPPLDGRRLKIGYVSGDFRQHPVSYFIEKLLSGHDRECCEVFAYSTCSITDEVTRRLRATTDHWTELFGLTDAEAAELIRKDRIDVLIDLSGHTAHNRLKVFALRSAPVQAHYLGFFGSTGLAEMDYWIGDAVLIPESDVGYYSEKIWRLPRVWINYHAGDAAPDPAWQPDPTGAIRFGSFNNLYKITPESIALWARILRNCPEGRMMVKTAQFVDPATRKTVLEAFAAEGIRSERISLVGNVPSWSEHMALYNSLDVALDPVGGVCGGTTTCDALWMGVPVITMAGRGMARRMSASMLTSLGRTEWIAHSADEYVEKAISIAGNMAARRDVRLHQRREMERSPLCDSRGLVLALEDGYEKMFAAWEDNQAESLRLMTSDTVKSHG